ncbi:hypothetical protein Emag_006113 [Eimeria magna]
MLLLLGHNQAAARKSCCAATGRTSSSPLDYLFSSPAAFGPSRKKGLCVHTEFAAFKQAAAFALRPTGATAAAAAAGAAQAAAAAAAAAQKDSRAVGTPRGQHRSRCRVSRVAFFCLASHSIDCLYLVLFIQQQQQHQQQQQQQQFLPINWRTPVR